jgi:hypothetical protein
MWVNAALEFPERTSQHGPQGAHQAPTTAEAYLRARLRTCRTGLPGIRHTRRELRWEPPVVHERRVAAVSSLRGISQDQIADARRP